MEPIKIAGLTLKSELSKDTVREPFDGTVEGVEEVEENLEVPDPDPTPEPIEVKVPTITEELSRITKRVEELPNSDKVIKALAKLKGALELLS